MKIRLEKKPITLSLAHRKQTKRPSASRVQSLRHLLLRPLSAPASCYSISGTGSEALEGRRGTNGHQHRRTEGSGSERCCQSLSRCRRSILRQRSSKHLERIFYSGLQMAFYSGLQMALQMALQMELQVALQMAPHLTIQCHRTTSSGDNSNVQRQFSKNFSETRAHDHSGRQKFQGVKLTTGKAVPFDVRTVRFDELLGVVLSTNFTVDVLINASVVVNLERGRALEGVRITVRRQMAHRRFQNSRV